MGEAWLPPRRRPFAQPGRPLRPPQAAEDRCGLTRPARPAFSAGGTTVRGWGQAGDPCALTHLRSHSSRGTPQCAGTPRLGRFLRKYCTEVVPAPRAVTSHVTRAPHAPAAPPGPAPFPRQPQPTQHYAQPWFGYVFPQIVRKNVPDPT